MPETTTDDIEKALGAFLICFGSTLPKSLSQEMQQRLLEMSALVARGGEPNVGTLLQGFADALKAGLDKRQSH